MRKIHLHSSHSYILITIAVVLICAITHSAQTGLAYRVSGRVINGETSTGIRNVEVEIYYDPLNSKTNDQNTLVATKTDVNGNFIFDALPGESEGSVRIRELPADYVSPMKETFRLSVMNPTYQVVFRAGPATSLGGTIVITNGTTDLTKFTLEVNATEVDTSTNGTFQIPELPAYQQTMRLIYQDGSYFDERVVPLPSLTVGKTTTMHISWHKPKNHLTTSGILRDVQGYVLANALVQFLGSKTGVFVGMRTDAKGNYAIYDLPSDCYAVRAFVGRYGLEQRVMSTNDSVLRVGN